MGKSWDKLWKEAKSCELLCQRCHREIHSVDSKQRSIKNKKLALKFKGLFSCELCGYDACNRALEFHHTSTKKMEMSDAIQRGKWKTISDIKNDIATELNCCRVLCSNCHRTLHADLETFHSLKKEIYEKIDKCNPKINKIDREKYFNYMTRD